MRRSKLQRCVVRRPFIIRSTRYAIESLEGRVLLTAVSWEPGFFGDGTQWTDPDNWSTNTVPGPSDDVTIAGDFFDYPHVVLDSGNHTIHSLTVRAAQLTLSGSYPLGGNLEVTAASSIRATSDLPGRLTIDGGILSGGGDLSVVPYNSFGFVPATVTIGGGEMSGSGSLTLNPLAALYFDASLPGGNSGMQVDRAVANFGIIGAISSGGKLRGGGINYSGSNVSIAAGEQLVLDGAFEHRAGSTLSNAGTLELWGSNDFQYTPTFNSKVVLRGGSLTAGGNVTFNDDFQWAGGSIDGPGTVLIPVGATIEMFDDVGTADLILNRDMLIYGTGTAGVSSMFEWERMNAVTHLKGAGDLHISGTFTWYDQGRMEGTGQTIIESGGLFDCTTCDDLNAFGLPMQGTMNLQRSLVNHGTINLSGDWSFENGSFQNASDGVVHSKDPVAPMDFQGLAGTNTLNNAGAWQASNRLEVSGDVSFSNSGILTVSGPTTLNCPVAQLSGTTLTGGTWNIGGGSTLNFAPGASISNNAAIVALTGAIASFPPINTLTNNTGNFSISGGAAFTLAAGTFTNDGLFFVGSGSVLAMTTGRVLTGSGDLSVAGTLNWTGGTMGGAGRTVVTATGMLNMTTGTLTLDRALDAAGAATLTNATLTGTGDLTVTGVMNWTGGTMTGSGKTIIANTGMLNLSTVAATRTLSRVLQNDGTVTWTDSSITFANGTFNNLSGGVFNVVSASAASDFINGGGTNAFSNAGTFNDNSSSTFSVAASVPFSNSNIVSVNAGTLALSGGGTNSGTIDADPGATLQFAATYTHSATSAIAGAGTVTFTAGTHNFVAGSFFNPTGTVNFSGTITINNSFTPSALGAFVGTFLTLNAPQSFPGLTFTNGTLNGSGDVTFTGVLNWMGGIMSGAGRTIIAGTGTLNLGDGLGNRSLQRILQNDGTANWTADGLAFNGGTVNNNGSLTANHATTFSASGGGTNAFNNIGSFIKQGAGTTSFLGSVSFNNSGTVDVQDGTLELRGGGVHTGDFAVTGGATLNLGGGTQTLSATSDITGPGNLILGTSLATLSDAGTVSIGGTVSITSGTSTFANTFSGGTSLSVSGTVNFNGTTNFPASATLTVSSGTANLGASNLTFASATVSGGTLSGSGDATVTGTLDWTGGTMTGSGKTIIASGGMLNMSTIAATRTLSRVLQNDGTVNWTNSEFRLNGGTFNNNGIFAASSASGLTCYGTGGTNTITNTGTFTKQGNGAASFGTAVSFNNTGNVDVQAGTLGLDSGGTHTNDFTVASTALLRFQGTHTLSASSDVTGDGNLTLSALTHAGTTNIGGTVTCNFSGGATLSGASFYAGNLVIGGGTTTFNTGSPAIAANASVGGGTLSGSADLAITGMLSWTGGTMSGTGKTIIASSGILSIPATGTKTLSRMLQLATGGPTRVLAGLPTFSGSGKLDLTDNAVVLDYTTTSSLPSVSSRIASGYNSGTWTGNGITSSTAASTPGTAVGYGEASQLFSSFPATFAGQQVDDSAVLIRYTLSGDADLGRKVNTLDFNLLAGNFGLPNKVFSQGDFNYDNSVNSIDFGILVGQYGNSLPASASPSAASGAQTSGGVAAAAPAQAVFSAAGWNNDQPLDELV